MSDILTAPFGTWPSPITAADVARSRVRLGFPTVAGGRVWWEEGRPDEGGRVTVVSCGADGNRQDMVPPPWNARTRVHEYGGRSYLPVPPAGEGTAAGEADWSLVFASFDDQRLYRCTGAAPRPLTPEPAAPGALRYADMVLSPDGREIWCVREQHDGAAVRRAIVAVPLDGSAAAEPAAVRVLVAGADFFAFPAPSPDGRDLAWISWDHPRMPWDGTELRVAPADGQADVAGSRLIMGGPAESVLAPVWRGNDSLYAISDASGWWNLYLADVAGPGSGARPLCSRDEEFAAPLWQLGGRPYAVLGDGRLAVLHGRGEFRFGVLDPDSGALDDPGLPYRVFHSALSASGQTVAAVAGGPVMSWSVVRLGVGDHGAAAARVLQQEAAAVPDPAYLPSPRRVQLSAAPNGPGVHALVYAPASPVAKAPEGELPPYIVWVHGGPTGCSLPVLDIEKAYFTSRGIGVIDVNYGGSCGYGRAYRERLRGEWGVVDVADTMTAALALAGDGEADRARLGIRGGSAGGWTALAAVTSGLDGHAPVFAAAVSYFGVADPRWFAATTHDFESRYLDGLVGPLPAAEAVYTARSPLGHVSPKTCPVLLLQGLEDPVVTPDQADIIAHDLAAHHIPFACLTFAGEAHGFRKAETIITCLEAELSFYGQVMGFVPPGVEPVELDSRVP